jgi:hypothetical protein
MRDGTLVSGGTEGVDSDDEGDEDEYVECGELKMW